MTDVNNNNIPEHVAENNLQPEYGPQYQQDGMFASVTGEDEEQVHEPYVPSDPLVIAPVPPRAPMEIVMATLVNAINHQGDFIREQNQRLLSQSQRLLAVEESRVTRLSRSGHPRRSPTPERSRSITRSRSPRPRRRYDRPPSPRETRHHLDTPLDMETSLQDTL
ncbi:hypothetical protein A2U01_0012364 [Trifolium medium]|uniref:Uncharacterized protein n=1 Tax=Trifolium medium TaxID=97028 RepID=A0A392MVA7_9FABA|nr:hypothetical protein [Trifolium medium]